MGNKLTAMGNKLTAMGNKLTAMGNKLTVMGNKLTATYLFSDIFAIVVVFHIKYVSTSKDP